MTISDEWAGRIRYVETATVKCGNCHFELEYSGLSIDRDAVAQVRKNLLEHTSEEHWRGLTEWEENQLQRLGEDLQKIWSGDQAVPRRTPT